MTSLKSQSLAAVLGACLHISPAQAGPDTAEADDRESAHSLQALDEAYKKKAEGDLEGAARAFETARSEGAKPELVALELGFLAATRGDTKLARGYFEEASLGADLELRGHAEKELFALGDPLEPPGEGGEAAALPQVTYLTAARDSTTAKPQSELVASSWWSDLYAEVYGWQRITGAPLEANLVPTLRLRALYRMKNVPELSLYGVAQATRDLASTASDERGLPMIYADNQAMVGMGVMMRFWERQLGLFAQAGPTVDLVGGGGPPADLDVRAGAFLGLESSQCATFSPESDFVKFPCREIYSEAVYVNRFRDNVIAFARGRWGFTYWSASPLLSQALAEGRVAVDTNGDYYNNFMDIGVVNRFRFLLPSRVDITMGIHGGSYFGVAGADPAPDPLGYIELRLLAATYLEL